MDNPNAEPSGAVDVNEGAALIAALLDPPEKQEPEEKVDTEVETKPEPDATPPEPVEEGDTLPITIKIDGKDVQLTPEQIAEAYKGQLRQADYTKKTMEAAEVRKSADAEIARAQTERQQHAAQLQQNANLLQAVLQDQSQIDWQSLLKSDPVEYLSQRHLFEQRQAALQQTLAQKQQMDAQSQAENAQAHQKYMQEQQRELLAKLPVWTDAAKAKAESEALRTYLKAEGYDDQAISGISDHKAVILARKAMLYDQMLSRAGAAAKQVAKLPPKMERPGVAESNNVDQRGKAFQTLKKTGRVEDAAAVFATFL